MKLLSSIANVRWTTATAGEWQSIGRGNAKVAFYTRQEDCPEDLHHAHQVHGIEIAEAGSQTASNAKERVQADGLFTTKENNSIAIKTADCLPVLITTDEPEIAFALHAGWKGLAGGILTAAILRLSDTERSRIHVALGPCISLDSFEVGPEVVEAFFKPQVGLDPQQQMLCLSKGQRDRWHIDLQMVAVCQLLNAGIFSNHIQCYRTCTMREEGWPSYRRLGADCGRIWSVIEI